MTPVSFPEANKVFGAPSDLDSSQVAPIPAYHGIVAGGSLDGVSIVVTAWKPDPWDMDRLNEGKPIFLSFIGGLPPHMATMDFKFAANPA